MSSFLPSANVNRIIYSLGHFYDALTPLTNVFTFRHGFSCVTSQQVEDCVLCTPYTSGTEVEGLNPSVINSFKTGLKRVSLALSGHVSLLGALLHLLFTTSPGCPEPLPQSFLAPGKYLKAEARDKLRKGQM